MTPATDTLVPNLAAYRRQYPDHLLIFRVGPRVHVVCWPGREPMPMTPGDADCEGLKAAGSGVPVLAYVRDAAREGDWR